MRATATPQGATAAGLKPPTERQAAFIALAREGVPNKEIARRLDVSVGTVTCVLSIMRRRELMTDDERPLTDRQLEVLRLVGMGMSNAEIGVELYMSVWTVVGHLRMIFERLGAHSRLNAVMLAIAREHLILDHDGQVLIPHAHRVAA